MEIKKFNINGKEIEFVNQWANTRNGFKHTTTMFIDGRAVQDAVCHYLNRTWECYAYQTVMLKAVREYMDTLKAEVKYRYMEEHGYKRLTDKRAEELERLYDEDYMIRVCDTTAFMLNR